MKRQLIFGKKKLVFHQSNLLVVAKKITSGQQETPDLVARVVKFSMIMAKIYLVDLRGLKTLI